MKKSILLLVCMGLFAISKAQNCPNYNINGNFEALNSTPFCDGSPNPSEFAVSKAQGWNSILTADVFTANMTSCLYASRVHGGTYAAGFSMLPNNHEYIYCSAGTLVSSANYTVTAYFKFEGGLVPASSTVGIWRIPGLSVSPSSFSPANKLSNETWTYESSTGWYKYTGNFTTVSGIYSIGVGSSGTATAYICVDDITLSLVKPTAVGYTSATPVCQPACVNFGATAFGGSSPYTFSWSNGLTGPNQTICTPGSYNLTATVTDKAGCQATAPVGFVINATQFVSAGADVTICSPANPLGNYALIGIPAVCGRGCISSYQWTPSTGLSDPTACSPKAYPGTTTTYNLKATSCNGCVSNDQVTVTVQSCSSSEKTTSTQETTEIKTGEVYPNPSTGQIQFNYNLESGQQGEFIIFDLMGNKLSTYPLIEGESILNINETSLSNGIYMYTVIVNNETIKTDKISIIK